MRASGIPPILARGAARRALRASSVAGTRSHNSSRGRDAAGPFERYRRHFEPSDGFPEPRTILALGAICGESEEEAVRLALSTALSCMRIARGVDRGSPTSEQAEEEFAAAGFDVDEIREELRTDPRVLTDDPDAIRDRVGRYADHCGADEAMIVTVTWSREARVRSYERIAEVMGTL